MFFSNRILMATAAVSAALTCGASAKDATSRALFFMTQAEYSAKSQLGYAPAADSDDAACCYPGAANNLARFSQIDHQISQLAAALHAPVAPIELSPADLARGAY